MSVKTMGAVWELDLEPPRKLVLLAMADHADHDGMNVRPSVRMVAQKTGYSERQVQRIIRELEAAAILVVQEAGTGRGHATHYRIVLPKGDNMTPFTETEPRQDVTHSAANPVNVSPIAPIKGDIPSCASPDKSSLRSNDRNSAGKNDDGGKREAPPAPHPRTGPPPEDLPATDKMLAWAAKECGIADPLLIERETAKFLDWHRSDRKRWKSDYVAAWRNWMRRVPEYAKSDGRRPSNGYANGARPYSEWTDEELLNWSAPPGHKGGVPYEVRMAQMRDYESRGE
jgi:hypothetical protein